MRDGTNKERRNDGAVTRSLFRDRINIPSRGLPGLTHTIMSVLLSCDRLSCSRKVRVELRKGMCEFFIARAAITSPRADSDLLMFCASFSACGRGEGEEGVVSALLGHCRRSLRALRDQLMRSFPDRVARSGTTRTLTNKPHYTKRP